MDTYREKKRLRKKLLNRRKAIPEDEYQAASATIIAKVNQLPEFKRAETVHCYVSMNDRGEVDTHKLIRQLFSLGKRVVVPITHFEDGTLSHVILTSFEELKENKWGVLEPSGGEPIAPRELDLVLVPMVGGDERGNRIGYGKGFYDRFLSEVSCPKVGLIFEQNIVERLPVNEFDVALDKIITEVRIIRGQ